MGVGWLISFFKTWSLLSKVFKFLMIGLFNQRNKIKCAR